MKFKITILCPTRDRPEGATRTLSSALKNAETQDVQVLFYVAEDDPQWAAYQAFGPRLRTGSRLTTTMAWNRLWAGHDSDLYMLGADDISFDTYGWDRRLLEEAEPFTGLPHVFHFRDSRHSTNTPHPIVNRAWTETLGWFMPPMFRHYYVDSFTCWVAKVAGVFTPIPDILLTHHKAGESAKRFEWTSMWAKEDVLAWHDEGIHQMSLAIEKVVKKAYKG